MDARNNSTTIAAAEQLYNKGMEFKHQKKYEKAIKKFTQVIELDPNHQDVYFFHRGYCYIQVGQYQNAIEDYSKDIELRQDPAAYSNRGNAHCKLGEFKKAITDYEKALEIMPDLAQAKKNLNKAKTAAATASPVCIFRLFAAVETARQEVLAQLPPKPTESPALSLYVEDYYCSSAPEEEQMRYMSRHWRGI